MSSLPVTKAPSTGRRWVAAALLTASVLLGSAAALRLARLGSMPEKPYPYVLAFVASLLLGAASGALSGRADLRRERVPPLMPWRGSRTIRLLAASLAVLSFAGAWLLQNRPEVPLWALGVWAAGILALPFAFPDTSAAARPASCRSAGLIITLLFFLGVGAAARFVGLDRVPAVRSGDENSIATDGRQVLTREDTSDPFGTGVGSCAHLAMMPAGAGYLLGREPIGGPRVGYALVGTLSLAAAATLAGAIAGPYAALGCLSLLVLAPLHVFWSRTSDLVIFDALIVVGGVWGLLRAWRFGSPRAACLAGLAAGMAFYSYNGARILPVILVLSAPLIFWSAPGGRARRGLVLGALLAGFLVCAAPGARFAARHFDEFNGRFDATTIFAPSWFDAAAQRLGSRARVLENQVLLGTLGLLSARSTIHFTGHPIVGPGVLVALGIAGFGWLLGSRRYDAAFLLGLVIGGNLAGTAFTLPTPGASRPSSLVPVLAVLGGVAIAALISLAREKPLAGLRLRTIFAAAIVGSVFVMALPGYPLDVDPYAESAGSHAAFTQSASAVLGTPFARRHRVFLHSLPYVNFSYPTWFYFLPDIPLVEVPPEVQSEPGVAGFPPGIHVVSSEYVSDVPGWLAALGLRRTIPLAHPAMPRENVGFIFVVPGGAPVDCRPYRPSWMAEAHASLLGAAETVMLAGEPISVAHSALDMGRIQDVFDGNRQTLVRTPPTYEAIVEMAFPRPRSLRGVDLTTATMDICLLVDVGLAGGETRTFWKSFRRLPQDPTVSLDLPGLEAAAVVALRVHVPCAGTADCYIHLREIRLR